MAENFFGEEINLRDYLRVFFKRRWLIATVLIIVVVSVTIETFRKTPIYRATVQVMIESENPKVVDIQEVLQNSQDYFDYSNSQYEILKSKALALKAINYLNLNENPVAGGSKKGFSLGAVFHGMIGLLKNLTSSSEAKPDSQLEEDRKNNSLIGAYLGRLMVEPIKNSRLVNISVEGIDPKMVTRIANTHAQLYIESNIERKFAAAQAAVSWLNQRIKEEGKKLQQSEEYLQTYREQEGLIDVDFQERQGIIMQSLNDLNTALTEAQTEKITKQQLSSASALEESNPAVMQNSLIQELKASYIALSGEHSKLSQKYGPGHPNMVRLSSQMQALQGKIAQEIRKLAQSMHTDSQLASDKEKAILAAMEAKKKEALALNQKQIKYDALKREVTITRSLFESLLKRTKEASITEGLNVTNIVVVDPARLPETPVRPQKARDILLALIIGLTLGIGLAFLLEYLDNTIKIPEEVEHYLKIPLLGLVGSFLTNSTDPKKNEIISHTNPKSTISEAYRTIRTNLLFSSPDNKKQVLLVTSMLPFEGKTVLCSNLAITFAKMGKKVLLIDADMRKPRIHKVFNLARGKGLSAFLVGEESSIGLTDIPGLKILTSGTLPPNPSELLSSKKMQDFIERAREQYDLIIFDSPPILSVSDSAILSTLADGVVVTIKASATPRPAIKQGLQQLSEVGGKVLGCVLNDVDFEKESYYHSPYRYHHYYYYHAYGEEEKKDLRVKG